MELNGWLEVFAGGALGPILVEVVKLTQMSKRRAGRLLKQWTYWLLLVALCAVGGIVAVAHGTDTMKLWTAIQLGASAPLLLGALATARPAPAGLRDDNRAPGLSDMLRW